MAVLVVALGADVGPGASIIDLAAEGTERVIAEDSLSSSSISPLVSAKNSLARPLRRAALGWVKACAVSSCSAASRLVA